VPILDDHPLVSGYPDWSAILEYLVPSLLVGLTVVGLLVVVRARRGSTNDRPNTDARAGHH
jgi:hypothetical protein